ncbi:hypothetical protein ACE193_24075 [Bernardetia sp. OM2101]|uniref:hypothetical protein n=1 Tax=Bernardetia sp. OM2101 TaxID=3344876 RepID=UPI0035CEB3E1
MKIILYILLFLMCISCQSCKENSTGYIIHLRRLNNYDGEFGFDWMRKDYKKTCLSYEELKKVYQPITLTNQEYLIPWISMFPNQIGVKLRIEVETNEDINTDSIEFKSVDGIKFIPNKFPLSEAQNKEVIIECNKPLTVNTTIEIINQDKIVVGKVCFYANHNLNTLKIKFLRLKGNEKDNTYNEKVFDQMTLEWMNELKEKFKSKYFNQALINIVFDETEDFIVDVERYREKKLLFVFADNKGKQSIPRYNKGFDDEIYKEYVEKNKPYDGILFLMSSLQQQGMELGHAKVYPRNSNYIMMNPSAVGGGYISFVHELGHALGLHHPWNNTKMYKERLKRIEAREMQLRTYLDKNKLYKDNIKVGNFGKTLGELRNELNKELVQLRQEKIDKIRLNSEIYFKRSTTENIMDYNGYNDEITQEIIYNPFSEGTTFWKWQWDLMNEEVKTYHSEL